MSAIQSQTNTITSTKQYLCNRTSDMASQPTGCHKLLRKAYTIASNASMPKYYSTIEKITVPTNYELSSSQWQPIYQLHFIKAIAGLNKLKSYQAAFTSAAVPVSMGLEMAAQLPAGSAATVGILGITGTAVLCLASYFTKNFIGFAYVREDCPETVRLSYIDFWGRRKNVEMVIDEIVPPSEQPKIPFDFWVPVKSLATNETYKLMHRHGRITDTERFVHVFGECQ